MMKNMMILMMLTTVLAACQESGKYTQTTESLDGVRWCELGPPNQCDIEAEQHKEKDKGDSNRVVSAPDNCVIYYADGRRENKCG